MQIKNNIANYITSLNLLCGCFSIYFLFQANFSIAIMLILAAAIFDFADGFVARLLHIKSEIGKQLDSLADVISFGLAPGIAMFQMLSASLHHQESGYVSWLPFVAFIIPVFSAWRLAKFNIDERQTESFIGLPTPGNAIFIFSLLAILIGIGESPLFPWYKALSAILNHPVVLTMVTLVFSYLLVSPLPLFSMKFKNFKWAENRMRIIFLTTSLVLLSILFFVAIPIIIILYIILSVINNINQPKT